MDTSKTYFGKIGNFDCKFTFDDAMLLINLEDAMKMSRFSQKIGKSDDIKKMTKNLCEDHLQLFELLKFAAEGSFSEISLELNFEKSALVYKLNQKIPFPKQIEFEITLEKEAIDPDTKIQVILEKYMERDGIICSPNFVPGNSSFTVSDDKKIVKKIANDNSWQGIFGDLKFAAKGRQEFSIKILNTTGNSHIMVGIALSTTNLSSGAYAQSTAWMFYCANNYIYVAGSNKQYANQLVKPSNNDIITVALDIDSLTMGIEINGFSLGPACKLNVGENMKTSLCPVVDLYNINDSVKFI